MRNHRKGASFALGICLGFQTLGASMATAGDARLTYYENSFNGRTYHHAVLQLSPDLFSEGNAQIDPEIGYRFSDGGLFEIYLEADVFGPAAGRCKGVTIRMPWTDPAAADSAGKIAGKKALFERIESLRRSNGGVTKVVLQLDPYLSVEPSGEYRLTQCIVFFRTAFGGYIDHPNPIAASGRVGKSD